MTYKKHERGESESSRSLRRKKRKRLLRVFRTAITVCLFLIFLTSLSVLVYRWTQYRNADKTYEDIRKEVKETVPETTAAQEATTASETTPVGESAESSKADPVASSVANEPSNLYEGRKIVSQGQDIRGVKVHTIDMRFVLVPEYTMNFEKLRELNPAIVAWITIPGTNIDYPVVQAKTNEEYLRRTVLGEPNNAGSIFADPRTHHAFHQENTIIHGHNQRNHGMFHDLLYYDKKSFFEKHPIIRIYLPEGPVNYEVFSAYKTGGVSEAYNCDFPSEAVFSVYLEYAEKRALYPTGVHVTSSDEIITLSTCTNDWDDGRFVVHAKKIS